MSVSSLELTNFRGFADFSADFDPHINLFVGPNGSGKTNLLEALAFMLSACQLPKGASPSLTADDIRHTYELGDQGFEEKRHFPMSVSMTLVNPDQTVSARYTEPGAIKFDGLNTDGRTDTIKPVFAIYSAYRLSTTDRDIQEIANWLKDVFAIACPGTNTPAQSNNMTQTVVDIVKTVLPDFQGITIHPQSGQILTSWFTREGGHVTAMLDDLGDAECSVLMLVADIVRRMILINPLLGRYIAQETGGFILIDELELHLHPRLQRQLIVGLPKCFPRVQFFATTHSPQIIGEVEPRQVFVLDNGKACHPMQSLGLSSSEVLTLVMNANCMSEKAIQFDTNIRRLVIEGRYDEAESLLEKFQTYIQGDSPETVALEELIAFERVINAPD